MSGDRRVVLADPTGELSPIVEALGIVVDQFRAERYALVGGLAVFCRVGAQRVTSDIDTAVAATQQRAQTLVAEVATRVPGRQPSFALPSGVVIDLLLADPVAKSSARAALEDQPARVATHAAARCSVSPSQPCQGNVNSEAATCGRTARPTRAC